VKAKKAQSRARISPLKKDKNKRIKDETGARAADRVHANVSSLHFAPFKADAGFNVPSLPWAWQTGSTFNPSLQGDQTSGVQGCSPIREQPLSRW